MGYLGVAPTRSTSPLFPKVFFVTGRGVRRLREALAEQGKRWQPARIDRRGRHAQEGYSPDRILHELLVTEFLLAVWQTVRQRPDLELLATERRSLARHAAFAITVNDRPTRLEPDAMFLFRQTGGGMIACFVELDRGTMNVKQIRVKYRRYQEWSVSEVGQQYLVDLYRRHGASDPKPNFRVLVIAGDRTDTGGQERMVDLYKATLSFPGGLRDRFWLTTVGDLREHQFDPTPLGAAVWRRAWDAREWLEGYTTKSAGPDGEARKQARMFISERLVTAPLHPLLPHRETRSEPYREGT